MVRGLSHRFWVSRGRGCKIWNRGRLWWSQDWSPQSGHWYRWSFQETLKKKEKKSKKEKKDAAHRSSSSAMSSDPCILSCDKHTRQCELKLEPQWSHCDHLPSLVLPFQIGETSVFEKNFSVRMLGEGLWFSFFFNCQLILLVLNLLLVICCSSSHSLSTRHIQAWQVRPAVAVPSH